MATGLVSMLAISCASGVSGLARQQGTYTAYLREQCHALDQAKGTCSIADSLHQRGKDAFEKGKYEEAYRCMDQAAIRYTLVLLQAEYAGANARIDELQEQKIQARRRLDTYKRIADQLSDN
jgi:Arc/MetJ-type ribon-helix-helix transcriptional regulator